MSIDTLDDFAPEPGGIGSGTVRVADVLARGVPVRWDEAVALLQEILETVTASGADAIPALEDVVIDREGAVTILGTRRGERGPVAAARSLHTLLATAEVPVPLRLFVTQANAPETHASLKAFADGLAYFGKPGRADLIRAIYERYPMSLPATPAAARPPVAPNLPNTVRDGQQAERKRTSPQWLIPAAVVVAIVSLGAVLLLAVFGGSQSGGTSVVAQAKAAVSNVKTSLAAATPQTERTRATSKSPVAQAEKPLPAARTRAQSNPRTKAPSSSPAIGAVTQDRGAARLVEPVLTRALPGPLATSEPPQTAVPNIPTTREWVVAPRERAVAVATIYSSSDVDVQPPVMVFPSLPPPIFVARNADAVVINKMELVIAADGSVERVRLVNGPTRMPDMMLLSGAKLWKFSPAVKDGVPVRYRTTVQWTGFP